MDCKDCPIGKILKSGLSPDDSLNSIQKVCNECRKEDELSERLKDFKKSIKRRKKLETKQKQPPIQRMEKKDS